MRDVALSLEYIYDNIYDLAAYLCIVLEQNNIARPGVEDEVPLYVQFWRCLSIHADVRSIQCPEWGFRLENIRVCQLTCESSRS